MPTEPHPGFARTETSGPLEATPLPPEADKILEPLQEIREILRELDACGWEAPQGGSAVLVPNVPAAGAPGKNTPACDEDEADALFAPLMTALNARADGTAMPPALVLAPSQPSSRRRSSAVFAALAAAGVVILGVTGLMVAQGPDLQHLMASVSSERQPHFGDRSEAAARAALPPVIPAVATGDAASRDLSRRTAAPVMAGSHRDGTVALLPTAAIAQPAPASGGNTASAAPAPAAAPRHASAAAPTPHPGAQAVTIPLAAQERAASAAASGLKRVVAAHPPAAAPRPESAAAPTSRPGARAETMPSVVVPNAADRLAGQRLREAGDARTAEGDIASARLFYERAAAAGDAQAALDLGNTFNPAFLERLGVLGMHGNAVAAARWYRRARMLGDPDAEKALQTLPR